MDVEETKDPDKQEFESRAYQTELLELALEKNVILYLPTGSGKTFISILLIKALGQATDLKRTIKDGGQRTFFLVNTVALVTQQVDQINSQTPYSVGGYCGDMGVDFWSEKVWHGEMNKNQVSVMTCQIFLNLLLSKVITLRNVNLLIFDECHRAVSNHPMRQIMQTFKDVPPNQQPKILGLTATLINKNIKPASVAAEIRNLEVTLISQIATSINEELVKLHSTNPRESRVSYSENDTTSMCYRLRDHYLNMCKALIAECQIDDVPEPPTATPFHTRLIDLKLNKTNKRLKNVIDDIQVNMDDLGVYGGSMAVLAHMVQLEQLLTNVQKDMSQILYQYILTQCGLLRKIFETKFQICNLPPVENLQSFSSDKVRKLFGILRKLKPTDSALVFVKRRFSAKILYYLMKSAAEIDPKLKHIKSNFIVGYNVGNPFKDTRENYVQRSQNKRVMNLFNQGSLNVLFASNVVEEGIDISQCNFVIMFDLPIDFRSYIQSKGRARDKNSNYILMVSNSDHSFDGKYSVFREVENVLKQILSGGKSRTRIFPTKRELEESLFLETPGLEPFRPKGLNGPVITCLSAIPLINRYLATLKQDKFTKISPYWWVKEDPMKKGCKCFLQLPMESKVRELVEGTWQRNHEDAKRSVALEACKKLYECDELDELYLIPIGVKVPDDKANEYTPSNPNDAEETEKIGEKIRVIGSKKHKRLCEKKWADCLCECRPKPYEQCYLHLLSMKPMYTSPTDNSRLKVVHQLISESSNFALLSTKILPNLAPFPLYMNTGELEGTVKGHQPITLDKHQLELIIDFHCVIFDNVLGVTKKFMLRDFTNTQNSFLIAPVIPGATQELTIDWNVIQEAMKPFPSICVKPSLEERRKLNISDKDYFGAVVSPWYREVPNQKYVVTKVCHEMSENTKFPNDSFGTYKDYYDDKYKLKPLLENQPLLEVRAFSSRLNSIKPRTVTKTLRRKLKEDNEEFEVWLLPEFCVTFPFPGRYWLKALMLPSFLHRISQLCMAEEVRCLIVKEVGVGVLQLPPGTYWQKLKEDVSLIKKEKICETDQALTPLSISIKSHSPSKSSAKLWKEEEEPLDIERNLEKATLFDIMNYDQFIKQPLGDKSDDTEAIIKKMTERTSYVRLEIVNPPPLVMLQKSPSDIGPEQVEVMQALITAGANDFVNCERLETLGDAFLKFAISIILFESLQDTSEGQLTNLKSRIVGNKNLYACGKKKNLGCILQAHDFCPNEEWVPPGFCVEHSVQGVMRITNLTPNCLYSVEIPEEERKAGTISEVTHDIFSEILYDAESVVPQNCSFINQQALTNKNVADAVEAILGVYLKNSGVLGALAMLNWFGVTKTDICRPEVFLKSGKKPIRGEGNIYRHLTEPDNLESILNYKFKDRSYMLEALTHPSYSTNIITPSYQRLEFIGDALIDFLITVHIYEKCSRLSPGDLTDLRSALVNNITLACIVVRNNLHTYLLHKSYSLMNCIMRFAKHQESKGHIIDEDILFLIEEDEVNISEAIEVPKALGDIFEALIGAIYLDSGKDLNLTWKVVYNLMKDEIEKFHKNVPKNHVRMIYESDCSPQFSSTLTTQGVVMVTLEILHKGNLVYYDGFGDTKQQAKRAAAKHALRCIRSPN